MSMDIETIHHVSLPVKDLEHLEQSKKFYSEILELQEIPRPAAFDFAGAWYQLGDKQLHLIVYDDATLRGAKGVTSHDIHFAVRVRSFRRALEFLQSKEFREDGENSTDESDRMRMKVSRQARAGFPQIYILDPNGHVIEINAEQLDL